QALGRPVVRPDRRVDANVVQHRPPSLSSRLGRTPRAAGRHPFGAELMNEQTPHVPSEYPDEEARGLEQALMTLRPSAEPIDRDRLMFLAGRATAQGDIAMHNGVSAVRTTFSHWLWPSATAISTVAA